MLVGLIAQWNKMFSTLGNLYTTLELGCSLTFVLLILWHSLSDALIMALPSSSFESSPPF